MRVKNWAVHSRNHVKICAHRRMKNVHKALMYYIHHSYSKRGMCTIWIDINLSSAQIFLYWDLRNLWVFYLVLMCYFCEMHVGLKHMCFFFVCVLCFLFWMLLWPLLNGRVTNEMQIYQPHNKHTVYEWSATIFINFQMQYVPNKNRS